MTRKITILMAVLLLWGGVLVIPQQLTRATRSSFVEFLPVSTVVASSGHPAAVHFTFHILGGYHINSNKPNAPELIPTQLRFSLPGDVIIGKVQYPAGQLVSFPFNPTDKLSVYSGDFTIRAMVIVPADSSTGAHTVHGELKYQACDNNSCYPPRTLPITFNVKVGDSSPRRRVRPNAQSPHIH